MYVYKDKHCTTLGGPKKGWPAHLWEATEGNEPIKRGGAKGKYPSIEKRKLQKITSDDSQMAGFLASNRSEATLCTTAQKGQEKERKEDQARDGMFVAGNGFEEFMASNRSHNSKGEETIDTHEARSIRGTTARGLTRSIFGKRLRGKQVVHKTEVQERKEMLTWRCPVCAIEVKNDDTNKLYDASSRHLASCHPQECK